METNLDKDFKTNSAFESEGIDMDMNEKVSFRVRRFNGSNPRVKAAMAAYYKPYARLIELGTLPQDKQDEITIKIFVDVCLVGWKGLEDKEGKPIPFNKENAIALFKSLPEVFASLWKNANDFTNYKEELGNS